MYIKDMKKLDYKARQLRYDLVKMLAHARSGHPGGSLSIIEILTTLYYGGVMKYDPKKPKMPDRDRLVLSKGHGSPALYVVLADLDYFPKKWLKEFDASGSKLPKHADRLKTPGIEASTGALGQGISMAIGMALAERLDKNNYKIFCILGDGECDSGNVWEAAMAATKFKLDNLVTILDKNRLQVDGFTDEVMPLYDMGKKFRSFGWYTTEADGHDVKDLLKGIRRAKKVKGKPALVIAHTVKGKGVSFMENEAIWHSAKITPDLEKIALKELKEQLKK